MRSKNEQRQADMEITQDSSDFIVPETPESKRPDEPHAKRATDCCTLGSDSDSDIEITGSSVMTAMPVKTGKSAPQINDVILLSDEEVTEIRMDVKQVEKNWKQPLRETMGQSISLPETSGKADVCKRRPEEIFDSSQESATSHQCKKRRRNSETDDSEDEGPTWKEQEHMVKRLLRKFPHLDKEELRDVLQEHNWAFEDTLEALRMFSDDAKVSSEDSVQNYLPSRATTKTSEPQTTPSQHTEILTGLHPPHNGINRPLRKRKQLLVIQDQGNSSEDSGGDIEVSSSHSDDSEWAEEKLSTQKAQILNFFQGASLDELMLMSGCSLKKAHKIVELRPYSTWRDLDKALRGGNGLSTNLLSGCREVLKERMVIQNLMASCENISKKMLRDVAQVLEPGQGSMNQPHILNNRFQLKQYQLIGLKWLSLLHRNQLSGILADEMGLGKTIQAISFLASLYQEGNTGPHLIIVPSSTLENWVRELKLWCPSLIVLVYHGSAEDRKYIRYEILNKTIDYNVIVTTYNLAIGNAFDRSLFYKLRLEYAVLDEGHMLKNMNSLRYRHLMAINAKYRLLLTGTPLQNNLLELMSLLNFIMPSMFSNSTTRMARMFSMNSAEEQSTFEMARIAHAKLIMKPFILRRVKSEVLKQLPDKEEQVEFCAMSEKQEKLYRCLLNKLKGTTSGEKRELTNVMMQLRKMANHPLLHRQYYTTERLMAMSELLLKDPSHSNSDSTLMKEDMEVMSDFELHRLCQQYPCLQNYQLSTDLLLDSGKFRLLTQLLTAFKEKGDRVVMFSQFTMMLDILEVFLKHMKHRYIRLDGSTPISDRIVLIDQFNTERDIFLFLLSTKAGGLGINLTSANVVILHDIDCNPYNDKQAEDRCHRVGQSRTVTVIKLISKDSIEDDILRIGKKKLKLEQDMTATQAGDNEDNIPDDMASLLKASPGL